MNNISIHEVKKHLNLFVIYNLDDATFRGQSTMEGFYTLNFLILFPWEDKYTPLIYIETYTHFGTCFLSIPKYDIIDCDNKEF
jgi:hypothetical protein